jgi:carbohydrate-binding DOMON domain-containing protein
MNAFASSFVAARWTHGGSSSNTSLLSHVTPSVADRRVTARPLAAAAAARSVAMKAPRSPSSSATSSGDHTSSSSSPSMVTSTLTGSMLPTDAGGHSVVKVVPEYLPVNPAMADFSYNATQ